MTTVTHNPTKPAADLDPGDRFLDPTTGLRFVFGYHRPGDDDLSVAAFRILDSGRTSATLQYLYLDPSTIVNVEAAR